MFAALGTRPDIAFSVTALSRYYVLPLQMHFTAAKRVLKYLVATEPEGCFVLWRARGIYMAYMATQTRTGLAKPQLESLSEDTSSFTVVL